MVLSCHTIIFIFFILLALIFVVGSLLKYNNVFTLVNKKNKVYSETENISEKFTPDKIDKQAINTTTKTTLDNLVINKGINPKLQKIFDTQKGESFDLDKVCSIKTNTCYNVRTDVEDVNKSVEIMYELNSMISKLLYIMKKKYVGKRKADGTIKPPIINDEYKKMITLNMLDRFDPDNIIENSTRKKEETSFVTAKGKLTALCLRKQNGTGGHENIELLKFITLHELSHIANSIPGTEQHGIEFWRTFKMILQEARNNLLCTYLQTENGSIKYCNDMTLYDSNLNLTKINLETENVEYKE